MIRVIVTQKTIFPNNKESIYEINNLVANNTEKALELIKQAYGTPYILNNSLQLKSNEITTLFFELQEFTVLENLQNLFPDLEVKEDWHKALFMR